MRSFRLFIGDDLSVGQQYRLAGPEQNYLRNVLRLSEGAEVVLFNGMGKEYLASLIQVSKKAVVLDIHTQQECDRESPLVIELGQAITKGDRMDFSVQKSVELGVNIIAPLFTQHGVVSIKNDRLNKKQQHWQKVAVSASEQSGRAVVPRVEVPLQLQDWIKSKSNAAALKLVLLPGARVALKSIPVVPSSVIVLIGPEGGFSDDEAALAIEAGFVDISLGPRILRAETATVTAISALQLLWGDLS
ncbi:MAG: 16S rRNA (uracil(1498)-N(3))-methyltransferase [Gammaproteobacteria bacterium]|nr:16S rRNA (uracil(1498)-N(3))-methyltransferase [Gammaproteobacteria bacterium]